MPNRNQAHIDRAMTAISVAYIQDAANFIADKVFPIISVKRQSDLYFKYSRADFFRDEAELRGPGTESAGGDYDVEQSSPYYCRIYAFHKDITREERNNQEDPLNVDRDATIFVTQKMLLRREIAWATKYFKTGVWGREVEGISTGTPTGTQCIKWSVPTSTPIMDINRESIKMMEATGYRPNTLVLSPLAFTELSNHEDFLNRIKYSQKGVITEDLIAQLFQVKTVLVAWAIKNSAGKYEPEANSFISGKHALLCYSAPNPGLMVPSAGYIFSWDGLEESGGYGSRIIRIPMPTLGIGTERIEGEMAFDLQLIASDLGVFFRDIV